MIAIPDVFQVSSSGAINDRIRVLYHEAASRGLAAEFDAAILSLYERLSADPHSIGEQTYTYHHLGLVNLAAIIAPLSVEFCIDDLRKLVYLRRINLL